MDIACMVWKVSRLKKLHIGHGFTSAGHYTVGIAIRL